MQTWWPSTRRKVSKQTKLGNTLNLDSELQNSEKIRFCCLSYPVCGFCQVALASWYSWQSEWINLVHSWGVVGVRHSSWEREVWVLEKKAEWRMLGDPGTTPVMDHKVALHPHSCSLTPFLRPAPFLCPPAPCRYSPNKRPYNRLTRLLLPPYHHSPVFFLTASPVSLARSLVQVGVGGCLPTPPVSLWSATCFPPLKISPTFTLSTALFPSCWGTHGCR